MAERKSTELSYLDAIWAYVLDLERVSLAERMIRAEDYKPGPYQEPLVYFHVLGGELMYIGQTRNYDTRQKAHRDAGRDWDEEWLILMPDYWPFADCAAWMNGIEYPLIKHLAPPYNYSRGRGSSHFGGYIYRHLRATEFAMPNGIKVGKRRIPIVQGPSLELARKMQAGQ